MATVAEEIVSTRRTKRTRVLMTGTLMTPYGAFKVRIRDISRTGAQIGAEAMVPPDCDAILKRGSLFAAARVSWSRGSEAGLRFYRQLEAEEVDSTLHQLVTRT